MTMAAPHCLDPQSLTANPLPSFADDAHTTDTRQRDTLGEVSSRYRTEVGSLDLEQLAQDQRHARQQVLLNAIQRLRAWWTR